VHLNAFLDYLCGLAETIHGFANILVEEYPLFNFLPDLLVMFDKSNGHYLY
jgi:hypothetical protein